MQATQSNATQVGNTGNPALGLVKELYGLFKLRIGFAIALSALVGWAVTPGPQLAVWQVVVLGLTVLLASAAAGAFNQYSERDLDRKMARTAGRPFASGRYQASWKWPVGITALLLASVGLAAISLNVASAAYTFLGAVVYGLVYTVWLKRRTWLNIVVGGLSGSLAILAGSAAVDSGMSPEALILALVMFLWTPPHFWSLSMALKDDYAKAGVPMLPVVAGNRVAAWAILGHTLVLSALAFWPMAYNLGWVYGVTALIGGGFFSWRCLQLVKTPDVPHARAAFRASLLQLSLLIVGAIIDPFILG